MERLDPSKLYTTFNDVTPGNPIIPRKYILTHSDITAELFLAVGRQFDGKASGHIQGQVLAKWRRYLNGNALYGLVQVDAGKADKTISSIRYKIFQQELPLALSAIRFGDRKFFEAHPTLDDAPIWITFASVYPEFSRTQYWGTPGKYAQPSAL